MYRVPKAAVVNYMFLETGRGEGQVVPHVVDTVCPKCQRLVSFTAATWTVQESQGFPKDVRCPRCQVEVTWVCLGGGTQDSIRLYFDADNPIRQPIAGLDLVSEEVMTPGIKRAFQSAVNVLAIGEAEAAAAACRRVLEGITRSVLGPQATTNVLGRQIQELAKNPETLAQPIVELSDILREGGNLGAHFSDDVETTIEDARRMLDLLEYLITYLFVIPEQIHRFRAEVLKAEAAAAETD